MSSCVVTGAGGFIGGHLVADLVAQGIDVRAVDVKPIDAWYQSAPEAENLCLDLSDRDACRRAVEGAGRVFNLAADMGGIGFIEGNKAECMLSVLINTHMLMAARDEGVERLFYASSACVYAAGKQDRPDVDGLAEPDAYPAMPEDGYGWEKLFSERMARHFAEDFGIETRVARYHNIYGPHGAYDGGREKAPAAICRKVATAVLAGDDTIEIWGDGEQTRSFTYVDDEVRGFLALLDSDHVGPVNIGNPDEYTILQLAETVLEVTGSSSEIVFEALPVDDPTQRQPDITLATEQLGWKPETDLVSGVERTAEYFRTVL